MWKERGQIRAARDLFFIYLSDNTVGKSRAYSDATLQYLDLRIKYQSFISLKVYI